MQTTFAGKTVLNGKSANCIFGEPAAQGGGGATDPGTAGADASLSLQVGSNKGDTIDLAAQSVMFSKLFQNTDLIKDKDAIVSTNKTTGAVTVDFTKAKLDPQEKTYLGNVIEELDKAIAIVK